MVNHRLRGAMLNAEVTPARLAELAQVDVKTVRRWLTEDRVPYPITRDRIARAVGELETFLWPALVLEMEADPAPSAVENLWPTRTSVPTKIWHQLFDQTHRQLDVLVYSGAFLLEILDLPDVLRLKAKSGVRIRLLVADGRSSALQERARTLGAQWLPEQCSSMAAQFDEVVSSASLRLHDIHLGASSFQFDGIMLVNLHATGRWASQSPVERLPAGKAILTDFYTTAFETTWRLSRTCAVDSWM